MWKNIILAILIFMYVIPGICRAEDSYLGKSLGLDFYSVIDDGNYSLVTKSVNMSLSKYATLGEFGSGCDGIDLIADEPMDIGILDYGKLSAALSRSQKIKEGSVSLTINSYQKLALCLSDRYNQLITKESKKMENIQKLSSIGLYTDGTKDNSDYDIMIDLDKINSLLFTEDLKYDGVVNRSSASLRDYLSGKTPKTLTTSLSPDPTTQAVRTLTRPVSPSDTPTDTHEPSQGENLANLMGASCTTNNTPLPLDQIMDSGFIQELDTTLQYGNSNRQKGGASDLGGDTIGGGGDLPDKQNPDIPGDASGDIFDPKGPCNGIFCIDVRMISGRYNLLGGSKSVSFESIITKHYNILEPIAGSSLGCQRMTNQMGESGIDKIKLSKVLSGLKVIYRTKAPEVKKFKSENTEKSKADAFDMMKQCAQISAGINTAPGMEYTPPTAGYSLSSNMNMTNLSQREIELMPQNLSDSKIAAHCFELNMQSGTKIYYESFMQDISQMEAFTRSMMQTITSIVSILTAMDSKPTGCN